MSNQDLINFIWQSTDVLVAEAAVGKLSLPA